MKPSIELIIVEQFDLVSGIRGEILAFHVTKNTNELSGVLALITVPICSFTELL